MPRKHGGFVRPDAPFQLAAHLAADGALPVGEAVELAVADWRGQVNAGYVSLDTVRGKISVAETYTKYVQANGCTHVADVTSEVLWEWVSAPPTGRNAGKYPTQNMMRFRRSVAVALYMTWFRLGITERNLGSTLPMLRAQARYVAALTPEQIEKVKDYADYDTDVSKFESGYSQTPACLALVLLGAQSGEVSAVRVCDVDLVEQTVYLHGGGTRYSPRTVPIDDGWAWEALAARLAYLNRRYPDEPNLTIAYKQRNLETGFKDRAAATSRTLGTLLHKAGVYTPGRTRVASINEYVALRVFAETGRVEAVAARLGMRSLDAAAHLVGYDWRDAYNPNPNAGGES